MLMKRNGVVRIRCETWHGTTDEHRRKKEGQEGEKGGILRLRRGRPRQSQQREHSPTSVIGGSEHQDEADPLGRFARLSRSSGRAHSPASVIGSVREEDEPRC
jgi:hypothetical protein